MTFLAFQVGNEASLFWILVIIAVCFAVMALSMAFVAFMVFRVVSLAQAAQARIEPIIQTANGISLQGKEIVEKFTALSDHLTTATRHFSESAGIIKEEVAEIRQLLGQTTAVAQDKIALVNKTIERTNGQFTETTDLIQSKIVEPARELAAVMAGVKKGLEVLLAPSPRKLRDAYNDDEMFIG